MIVRLACAFAVASLCGCIPDAPPPVTAVASSGGAATGAHPAGALRRGINLGNALDAPNEGEWGVVLEPPFFDAIAAAGFDHVRIPIRFSAHAAAAAPFTIDDMFFRRVDWAVDQAQRRGLAAIIDLHHYLELMSSPDAHAARFVGLWRQIAERYRGRPASVYYELLNEPTDKLTAERWNALLVEALRAVRAVDPARDVIIDSVFWAAAKELANLTLPAGDPHLIASFHMYQPVLFTHQGMPWMPPEFGTKGVVFPGPPQAPIVLTPAAQKTDWVADWFRRYNTEEPAHNPGGPSAITEQFEMARAYTARTGIRLYMGEFGTGDVADAASRVRWTRAVRAEAERRGIGWAYWDDGGSFKVYDQKARAWNVELERALLE